MHRFRGTGVWNRRTSANTVFDGGESVHNASRLASHQNSTQPTQLTWTQTSAQQLSDRLGQLQRTHVVYLGSAIALSEWTDSLRESMADFAACARTEFNIGDDLFKDLLQSQLHRNAAYSNMSP